MYLVTFLKELSLENFTPELQLIIAILSYYSQNINHYNSLDDIIPVPTYPTDINWQLLYKLTIRHRVTHQVYSYLNQLPNKTLSPTYLNLTQFYQTDKLCILAIAGETVRIAREFAKNNITYALVKGIILNVHIYNQLDSRSCKDIDVWVDQNQYKIAMDILYLLGYKKHFPTYELHGYKEQYYLSHRHDIAFYHNKRKVCVELHFNLNYFGINYFPIAKPILQPITLLGTLVYTLDDNYHLLYLMLHSATHAYSRIRWLNDIVLYVKSGKCDLNKVLNNAGEIGAIHIVVFSLILIRDIFAVNNPEIQLIIAQNSTKQSTYLVKLCEQFIRADYELIDGVGSSIVMFSKYRWYLLHLAVKGQRLKALLGDWFKIDNLFPYMTLPTPLAFVYYLCYPFWVIKYLVSGIIRQAKSSIELLHNQEKAQ